MGYVIHRWSVNLPEDLFMNKNCAEILSREGAVHHGKLFRYELISDLREYYVCVGSFKIFQ